MYVSLSIVLFHGNLTVVLCFYLQPLYGLLKAKLDLITHAYFNERDFSKVELLQQTYNNLNASLADTALTGTQIFLGRCWLPHRYFLQCIILSKKIAVAKMLSQQLIVTFFLNL
jgi:hypothetical protein